MDIKDELDIIIKKHINEINEWINFVDIHLYKDKKNRELKKSLEEQLKRLSINIDIFIQRSDEL